MPAPRMNERGMAVLSVIIVGVIFLSLGVWFMSMSSNQVRGHVHQRHRQRALDYAESGLEAAQEFLQRPDALNFDTYASSGVMPDGDYHYVMVRDTQADTDFSSRVVITSSGSYSDKPAMAVIESQVDVYDIDDPLIAVPGLLKISPGFSAAGGMIYGGDLLFTKPRDSQRTDVADLFYTGTLKIEEDDHEIESEDAPGYVVFHASPTHPQRLGYAPRLPTLTPAIRDYYRQQATSQYATVFGGTLDGLKEAPAEGKPIYFSEGDLHVGRAAWFRPQGQFVVYVQGDLILHKPVYMPQGSWVVFLVEKDIVLTDQMSPRVVVMGTYLANGGIRYEGMEHSNGALTWYGGMIAHGGIDLAHAWGQGNRRYVHAAGVRGALPLPHMTQRRQYRILQGKY
jgi:hypothetical protein